jgi:hypothetical protein
MSSSDKRGCHATHDRVVTCCRLAINSLEVLQLLVNVFFNLTSQVRVGRGSAVAVGAMAGDTNGFSDDFALGGVGLALAS